jgi:hypothetical protein
MERFHDHERFRMLRRFQNTLRKINAGSKQTEVVFGAVYLKKNMKKKKDKEIHTAIT